MAEARIRWTCGVLVLAAVWMASAAADVVSDWAAMSSSGLPAKVVYWKDVDGTDDGDGAICVMDLITGVEQEIINELDMGGGNMRRIQQSTSWGPMPCWSPDGTRIYFFNRNNDWANWVMDADGSNPKRICTEGGYWLCSWWDNDWVVYGGGSVDIDTGWNAPIRRVRIDALNNPVEEVTVVGFDPYGGSGRSYLSMSGDFVAWTDGDANAPYGPLGGHRSIVRNWNTGEEMEVTIRNDDACDICIKPDGSGTAVYCHANHYNATARTYQTGINPGTELFAWTAVQGEEFHWLRWSQHPDYICYNDDRDTPILANQRAYIRKVPAGTDWMFLGNGIWGPDVWVERTIAVTIPNGSENWGAGSSETVTWNSSGISIIKIELSTDSGATWSTLVASTANDGSEPVTVPAVDSTQCLIRVGEMVGWPTDTSDAIFTIVGDVDSDGIPDAWELQYFATTADCNPGDDSDSDGLNNLEEYQNDTNPLVDDTDSDGLLDGEEVDTHLTDPNDSDSDNDGLSDGDEVNTHLTDPNDSDSDDDGWSDGDELDYGTDPLDGGSHPSHPLHGMEGGCAAGGTGLTFLIAIVWLAARLRRRGMVARQGRSS